MGFSVLGAIVAALPHHSTLQVALALRYAAPSIVSALGTEAPALTPQAAWTSDPDIRKPVLVTQIRRCWSTAAARRYDPGAQTEVEGACWIHSRCLRRARSRKASTQLGEGLAAKAHNHPAKPLGRAERPSVRVWWAVSIPLSKAQPLISWTLRILTRGESD